jgi:hypothetical protein
MGWSSNSVPLELAGKMVGCGGWTVIGERFDSRIPRAFLAAARAARRRRAHPRPTAERVYLAGELACAPKLPAIRVRNPDAPGAARHPAGPYPQAMAALNAHADVTTSFVVDTIGAPIPATLRVMPGSDPRAVAALRASIGNFRFSPATRAGVHVAARVIRTWLFEPPPVCTNEDDGADCPRTYAPRR